MTVIINGTTGIDTVQDGIVTDGKLNLTANSQEIKDALNATGTAPIYACRAWVNFNGTGTVAIRASGNVSSITDNGTGDYTVNFTTAMPDANYSVNFGTTASSGSSRLYNYACIDFTDESFGNAPTASAVRIRTGSTGSSVTSADYRDVPYQYVSIFR
jgi:hypothetical protein